MNGEITRRGFLGSGAVAAVAVAVAAAGLPGLVQAASEEPESILRLLDLCEVDPETQILELEILAGMWLAFDFRDGRWVYSKSASRACMDRSHDAQIGARIQRFSAIR